MWICIHCNAGSKEADERCFRCGRYRDSAAPSPDTLIRELILCTTPAIETHRITRYLGPVFGESIVAPNAMRDFVAGFSDVLGGSVSVMDSALRDARECALRMISQQGLMIGANPIVGIRIDYELSTTNRFLVTCMDTAVVAEPKSRGPKASRADD